MEMGLKQSVSLTLLAALLIGAIPIGAIPIEASVRIWPKDPFQSKAPTPYDPLGISMPDSTAPSEKTTETTPMPRLQGIVKIENRYRAMIDDTIRRKGETFGPYRVQNIGADHVTLRDDNGHIFQLEFEQ